MVERGKIDVPAHPSVAYRSEIDGFSDRSARERPRTPPICDQRDRQSASKAPSVVLLPTAASQQLLA